MPETSACRVALLTNFVPPYRVPVLEGLAERVGALRILVSTPMEANRGWAADWGALDVVVQRTLSVPRVWRHPAGFRERIPVHVPLDTGRRLRELAPDVVISAELGMRSLQAARWCGRTGRRLVIWATLSERTERGRGRLRRSLRRHILARADGVIVNGASGARYIDGYGYPRDRVHTVPYSSPVRAPTGRTASAEGPLEVLYVGQLVERKGVEPLVRGLRRWCRRTGVRVRLTLAGDGASVPDGAAPDGAQPEAALLEVRRLGGVAFEELARHYAAADLLAFPTLADEWGLVVNEAMACGLPVLGSVHSQAVTELVEEGRTGWIYDPEVEGELEEALDRMNREGRERLREMGRNAQARVADLSPERVAERLAAVVADVTARDRRRP